MRNRDPWGMRLLYLLAARTAACTKNYKAHSKYTGASQYSKQQLFGAFWQCTCGRPSLGLKTCGRPVLMQCWHILYFTKFTVVFHQSKSRSCWEHHDVVWDQHAFIKWRHPSKGMLELRHQQWRWRHDPAVLNWKEDAHKHPRSCTWDFM